MMASQGWRVVQAHIPMIRFRKGGIERVAAASQSAGTVTSQQTKSTRMSSGPGVVSRPIIEDYQLPQRYHRRPLDSKEIEYINRGGPE